MSGIRIKSALVFGLLASYAILSLSAPVVLPSAESDDDLDNLTDTEDVEVQSENTNFYLAQSDPAQYSFSDVHTSCTNIATIDSPGGWCSLNGNSGTMTIDLKRVMNVEGVQTQGRGDCHSQWVSAGDISYSVDGQRWEAHVCASLVVMLCKL